MYQIQNANSHLCVEPDLWSPYYGSTYQDSCRASPDQYWEISSPNESYHVNLINAWTGWCLATYDASGNNHTPVILSPCDPAPSYHQNIHTTWQLG